MKAPEEVVEPPSAGSDSRDPTGVGRDKDAGGIEVGERVNIPDELIPADAQVEIDAKMAAGYFTPGQVPDSTELGKAKGRGLDR